METLTLPEMTADDGGPQLAVSVFLDTSVLVGIRVETPAEFLAGLKKK